MPKLEKYVYVKSFSNCRKYFEKLRLKNKTLSVYNSKTISLPSTFFLYFCFRLRLYKLYIIYKHVFKSSL